MEPQIASSFDAIGLSLKALGAHNVLLFRGRHSYNISGAAKQLSPQLAGCQVTTHQVSSSYPTLEELKGIISMMRREGPFDVVVAIGGGTVMDTAKTAALLVKEEGDLARYVRHEARPSGECVPLILVPTTSGTGAEITPFAVVYIDDIKFSLAHPAMQAHTVLLEPTLTKSLPPRITAYTGCDALSQVIEGFWSALATDVSQAYSREAIPLILKALPRAIKHPTDMEARAALQRGAFLSGQTIAISRTTAAHALSYPLTAFHGIPHGHAVMLTLPYFFPILAEADQRPLQDGLQAEAVLANLKNLLELLGVDHAIAARDKLLRLMDLIGLPRRLRDFGVTEVHLPRIVSHGFNPQRVVNFPVKIDIEIEYQILQAIL